MQSMRHPNLLPMYCSFSRGTSSAALATSPPVAQASAEHAAQLARAASSRRFSSDSPASESEQLAGSVKPSQDLESLPEHGTSEPAHSGPPHSLDGGTSDDSKGAEAGKAGAAMCLVLPYVSGGSLEEILQAHFHSGMVRA